jgi:hypothetical protein
MSFLRHLTEITAPVWGEAAGVRRGLEFIFDEFNWPDQSAAGTDTGLRHKITKIG